MANKLSDVIYVIVVLDCNKELGSKMKTWVFWGGGSELLVLSYSILYFAPSVKH